MDTMGAPDSSTAARQSSTDMTRSRTGSYSRMRPQPSQARLHFSRGSSIVTSGNRLRRAALLFRMYQPSLRAISRGLAMPPP